VWRELDLAVSVQVAGKQNLSDKWEKTLGKRTKRKKTVKTWEQAPHRKEEVRNGADIKKMEKKKLAKTPRKAREEAWVQDDDPGQIQ